MDELDNKLDNSSNFRRFNIMDIDNSFSNNILNIYFFNNPDPIWLFDVETLKFLEVNQAAIDCYGYSREEFLNMTIMDIRTEEEKIKLNTFLEKSKFKPDFNVSGIWNHLRKNKEVFKVLNIKSHQFTLNNRIVRLIQIKDISSENVNYRILDNLNDAFYCLDRDWNFTYLNKAAENLLKRTSEDLIGENIWKRNSALINTKFYSEFSRAMTKQIPVSFEEFYAPFNKYYQVHAYPYLNSLAVYFRDITSEKQLKKLNINNQAKLDLTLNTLENLLIHSLDIICTVDREGKFITISNACQKVLGYLPEELIGKRLIDFVHPEEKNRTVQERQNVLVGSATKNFENRYIRKDGSVAYLIWSSYWSENDNVTFAIAKDITEKKQYEEELSKKETFYRLLVENSLDLLILTDKDWKKTYVSPSILNFGYTQDEFLKMDISSIMHPDDLKLTFETFNNIISNPDTVYTSYFRMKNKNGEWRYMEGTAKNMLAHPDIKSIVITRRDITVNKQKEEKIKAQANLLEKSKDAIMVYDLNWNITFFNNSAEKLYGWKKEEILGKNAKILYKNQEDIVDSYNLLIKNGEYSKEVHKVTKDNLEVIVDSNKTLVYDDDNHPESILVINTDITEKKDMENQFLRAQRLESLGILASGIAHDLNNALTPILMSVEILKMKLTDEKSMRILGNVRSATLHAAEMVKQILTFAKGSQGNTEVFKLNILLKELERIITDTFPKNISIKFDINDDLWSIKADSTQIHQVIMNLCVNSKDALPNGGSIKVRSENIVIDEHYAKAHHEFKTGLYILLEVSDSGTGIPKETLDKVFDPFFTTKEVGKGTGLGLSTSLSIIKSHNGFINIYSEPGNGTKVKIYLPAIITNEFEKINQQKNELLRGNNELILIIDDDQTILNITEETLTSFGYRVIKASDGTEGIAAYIKNIDDIKLVLTDMVMPYMDGLSTIRALLRINPKLKIIAASGLEANGKISQAFDLGISYFIVKPYPSEKLLKCIKEIIEKTI